MSNRRLPRPLFLLARPDRATTLLRACLFPISITATVQEIEDQRDRQGNRCYRNVMDKQRHALATALLKKYGTARNVVKAGWALTDQQIDQAQA